MTEYIYHQTPKANLESILKKGLVRRYGWPKDTVFTGPNGVFGWRTDKKAFESCGGIHCWKYAQQLAILVVRVPEGAEVWSDPHCRDGVWVGCDIPAENIEYVWQFNVRAGWHCCVPTKHSTRTQGDNAR